MGSKNKQRSQRDVVLEAVSSLGTYTGAIDKIEGCRAAGVVQDGTISDGHWAAIDELVQAHARYAAALKASIASLRVPAAKPVQRA